MSEPEVIISREGGLGRLTLNRPAALGALTFGMCEAMIAALVSWRDDRQVKAVLIDHAGERGFCAGGDIRGLYDSIREGGDLGKAFWRDEYIMNSRIASYPKPYIAYMDGMVMGGGVGLGAMVVIVFSPSAPSSRCPRSASAFFRMSAAPGCSPMLRASSVPISASPASR